jgi:hypothetical protein
MKVNRWVMPVLVLVLLGGVIGAAQATGLWASTGRGTVGAGQGGGGGGAGAGGGEGSTQVVKGWMTLAEAADAAGLPVATVAELTGAPDPASIDPATPLNQLEELVPGFTMSAFRDRIAEATAGAGP